MSRQFLRVEYRGRTIAAADSLHEIIEAFRLFRPRNHFICDIVVNVCHGEDGQAQVWGRIIGYPNGMLCVEPRR